MPVSQHERYIEEKAADSEGMWALSILGMAEPGTCGSRSGCDGTWLPANLLPADA